MSDVLSLLLRVKVNTISIFVNSLMAELVFFGRGALHNSHEHTVMVRLFTENYHSFTNAPMVSVRMLELVEWHYFAMDTYSMVSGSYPPDLNF